MLLGEEKNTSILARFYVVDRFAFGPEAFLDFRFDLTSFSNKDIDVVGFVSGQDPSGSDENFRIAESRTRDRIVASLKVFLQQNPVVLFFGVSGPDVVSIKSTGHQELLGQEQLVRNRGTLLGGFRVSVRNGVVRFDQFETPTGFCLSYRGGEYCGLFAARFLSFVFRSGKDIPGSHVF